MNERYNSFVKSLERLSEIARDKKTITNRDAAIKRFEFTIELAWKCIQRFMREEEIICRSPKECLKEAFKFGLIEDNPLWLEAFEDRNKTSHTYDETTADEVYERLPKYIEIFGQLRDSLPYQKKSN